MWRGEMQQGIVPFLGGVLGGDSHECHLATDDGGSSCRRLTLCDKIYIWRGDLPPGSRLE